MNGKQSAAGKQSKDKATPVRKQSKVKATPVGSVRSKVKATPMGSVRVAASVQHGCYIAQLKDAKRALAQVAGAKAGSREVALEVCKLLAALINQANLTVDQMLTVRAELLSGRTVAFGGNHISLALLNAGLAEAPLIVDLESTNAD